MAWIKAIDVLYSPDSVSCSTKSPAAACTENPPALLQKMDAAGVEQVLLSPCKRWQCERHWQCGEVQTDDIAQYVRADHRRFAGMAWYNPYAITESLLKVKAAVRLLDMRGVYIHTEGSDIPVLDRRLYPLYSKCVELGVPVLIQVGIGDRPGLAHPSKLADLVVDFPELDVVAGWTGALEFATIAGLARKSEHMFFAFPASDPAQDSETTQLLASSIGQRCMWGSSGLPWNELLDRIRLFPLPQETLHSFLHDTAERLFGLSRPVHPLPKSEESVSLAE